MTLAHQGPFRRGFPLVAEAVLFTATRVRNPVLLTLVLVGGISAGVAGFISYAPNRLVGAANGPLDSRKRCIDHGHRRYRRGDDSGCILDDVDLPGHNRGADYPGRPELDLFSTAKP